MSADLSHLLGPVARRLCGEPSPLSHDAMLHFGPSGSLWVDLDAHTWGDSEDDTAGGDVLALVAYRTGSVNGGCEAWLTDHGFSLAPPINGAAKTGHDAAKTGQDRPSELVNLELEQALLGAVLMDPGSIHGLAAVQPEHFSEPLHRRLWDIMREMTAAGRPPSPVTIAPYLPSDVRIGEMDARGYVAALAAGAPGMPAADLAKGVVDLGQLRSLQAIGHEITEHASARDASAPPRAQIAAAITRLTALSSQGLRATQRASTAGAAAKDIVADMDNPEPRQKPVSTGMADLDRVIGGYRRGNLLILAARPGMGKSTLAASSGLTIARRGHGVIFFSMEMTKPQLTARLISDAAFRHTEPVQYSSILNGEVKDDHRLLVKQGAREIAELPFIIDPQSGLSIAEIGVRAQRYIEALMKRGVPTALVVVDHLGKVARPGRANDNVELGQVTSRAAELAKELDTCMLMLCQLNRMVEQRDDQRPRLSDLRESGHIEEDADGVMMIYREHYYARRKNTDGFDADRMMSHDQRILELSEEMDVYVTKNRHGEDGHARLWCHMGAASVRDRDRR